MVATRALVTTRETICTCDDAHAFVSHRLRSATALPSNLPNLPEHIENDPPSAPANEMQVIDPAAGIDPRARGVWKMSRMRTSVLWSAAGWECAGTHSAPHGGDATRFAA